MLKQGSMVDKPSNLSVLGHEHAQAFKQALARLLATDVAETTYAEILDGLPTADSFIDFTFPPDGDPAHPIYELHHDLLCPGVLERTRQFRSQFDPLQLTFSATVSPAAVVLATQNLQGPWLT